MFSKKVITAQNVRVQKLRARIAERSYENGKIPHAEYMLEWRCYMAMKARYEQQMVEG
jgi:hypothetical protein